MILKTVADSNRFFSKDLHISIFFRTFVLAFQSIVFLRWNAPDFLSFSIKLVRR